MHARVLMQPAKDLGVHPRHPVGCVEQPLPVGIFPHGEKDLTHGAANAGEVDGSRVDDAGLIVVVQVAPDTITNRRKVVPRRSLCHGLSLSGSIAAAGRLGVNLSETDNAISVQYQVFILRGLAAEIKAACRFSCN
jgi:hypothetical protein